MENAGEKTAGWKFWMDDNNEQWQEHHTELFRGLGKAARFQLKSQVLALLVFFFHGVL